MRDAIVEHRVKEARDRFVDAISPTAVCDLASSHHNGDPCTIFRPAERGSFNVCFFVEFPPSNHHHVTVNDGSRVPAAAVGLSKPEISRKEGDRWVVRVAITPRLAFLGEKLQAEVATMRYIAAKTRIPIPKLHAHSLVADSPIGMAFLIMDYVEGTTLSQYDITKLSQEQKTHVYAQLADVALQLRQQEFPKIGALTFDESTSAFEVRSRPLSVEMVIEELQGLDPAQIFPKHGVYDSSNNYISSLLRLAVNEFERSRHSVHDKEDGRRALYALTEFKRYVTETWMLPELDQGPFVLMHGDLQPANILLNEDLDIIAVVDWEWSRIVPVQLFHPPTWLTGRAIEDIAHVLYHEEYLTALREFLDLVREREKLQNTPPLLSKSWEGLASTRPSRSPYLVAAALHSPLTIVEVFWSCLYLARRDVRKYVLSNSGKEKNSLLLLKEKINQDLDGFSNNCDYVESLLNRKVRDQREYMEDLDRLGIRPDPDALSRLPSIF